jgi:hypothetical protein
VAASPLHHPLRTVQRGCSGVPLDDFETRAFWGYALDFSTRNAPFMVNEMDVQADLNGDGQVTDDWVDVPAFIMRENPPGNDLTVVPINIPR